MLHEDFGSGSARPKEDNMLNQLAAALAFTPEEARLNARGELSERQRQKFVRRGITASAVILAFSTFFVLDYLYLLFLYPRERLDEWLRDLLIWGSVIFGTLYATTIITSIALLRQHLRPTVHSAAGKLEIPAGRRLLKIGGKRFILEPDQAWQLSRLPLSGQYTLYYFTSLLGDKLLSVDRQDT